MAINGNSKLSWGEEVFHLGVCDNYHGTSKPYQHGECLVLWKKSYRWRIYSLSCQSYDIEVVVIREPMRQLVLRVII